MTNLAVFRVQDILAHARGLQRDRQLGLLDDRACAAELSRLVFRDPSGAYWALEGLAGGWLRFSDGKWAAGGDPPGTLEGPAALPLAPPLEEDALETRTQNSPPHASLFEALRAVVRRTADSYRRGWLVSGDADFILGQHFLLDTRGRPWTVGCASGRWYSFDTGSWAEAAGPPPEGELLGRVKPPAACPNCGKPMQGNPVCRNCGCALPPDLASLDERAYRSLLSFVSYGLGTCPEPVAQPWQPPESFPDPAEPGAACGRCGARNLSSSLFCTRCGARLGCPNCGAQNPPGNRSCSECGRPLPANG